MNIPHRTLMRFMVVSSIALGVSLPASAMDKADSCEGRSQMHGEREDIASSHFPPFLHGLSLTEVQKNKISDLMNAQEATMHDKAKEARKARMEIRQISMSNNYDEAKVKALSEASAGAMAGMEQMRARTENEIYLMLTPEQRKQIEEQKMRYKPHSRE